MQPIISVVGRSESGKTTLLEGLVAELKRRGHKVAVIKHAGEGFELDRKGSDTWRLSRAGSEVVAISSPREVAVIKQLQQDLTPEELSWMIGGDYDILLTEGFKQSNTQKIEVHRKDQGNGLLTPITALLAVVTDEPMDIDVPQFTKDDISGLADLVEKRLKAETGVEEAELLVNDAQVPLNPFVKSTLSRVLLSLVSGLKGVGNIRTLRITLRRKS